MASKNLAKQGLRYLLGVCVPTTKDNAAKIRVRRLELDKNLLMYFNHYEFIYADDPKKNCKVGDTVLIQNLPKPLTRVITHKVVEIVYPLGDIKCPLTGEPVVGNQYRRDMEEISKQYGELQSKFRYTDGKQRGRLLNIRDFTDAHKKVYVKYTEDGNNTDPYAVYP